MCVDHVLVIVAFLKSIMSHIISYLVILYKITQWIKLPFPDPRYLFLINIFSFTAFKSFMSVMKGILLWYL